MDFIEPFLRRSEEHRLRTGRPFVTLSYAQSLDGSISAQPGESLALSCRQSLKLTHRLRAGHDAILVGIGTVLSDNPRLNVRLVDGESPRPVIVDSNLRLPLTCRLLTEGTREPWIMTRQEPDRQRVRAIERTGARVLPIMSRSERRVDLDRLLIELARRRVNSLMVEGGARIITSFLLGGLVDYLVLTVAPVIVGGLRAVSDVEQTRRNWQLSLRNPGQRRVGEDLIVWGGLSESVTP